MHEAPASQPTWLLVSPLVTKTYYEHRNVDIVHNAKCAASYNITTQQEKNKRFNNFLRLPHTNIPKKTNAGVGMQPISPSSHPTIHTWNIYAAVSITIKTIYNYYKYINIV